MIRMLKAWYVVADIASVAYILLAAIWQARKASNRHMSYDMSTLEGEEIEW